MREANLAGERGELQLVFGVGVRVREDDRERAVAFRVQPLQVCLDFRQVCTNAGYTTESEYEGV